MKRDEIAALLARLHFDAHPPVLARRLGGRARVAVLALIALLAGVAGWAVGTFGHGRAAEAASVADAALPGMLSITTATTRQLQWQEQILASGAIVPWQEASLASPLSGLRVASVEVDVGDLVGKGQVLARLDDAVLRADVLRLRAALAQAQALHAQARRDAERAVALRASKFLSEQAILQATTRVDTAAADVRVAQAALAAKRIDLANTVLRAPDAGVISARAATPGGVPQDGEALFTLIRQHRLEWRGEVTAAQLSTIAKGQVVRLTLADGTHAEALVRQTSPVLGSDSRLGLVYADIRSGSTARAGMYVEGRIGGGTTPAMALPAASVVVRDGRSCVFVLQALGARHKVALREVTVRRRQGALVEIVAGVSADDVVAHEGAAFLADGDQVRIVPASAAAMQAGVSKAGSP
ncbi:efflux RND transporter periplasmic adaptor subunit [Xanthomonas sp. NCPPB 2654]|uniref:efflux RND transporter periplasmic adaptor subunit n=1 Tax=Xanthomonas sp. NCPPB 2654 TaxID=487541 RepID=UPI00256F1B89|nr:efflux RND transporter periplasmic adaptor subunit [Xanthomonas sp. NCPPB 2654]